MWIYCLFGVKFILCASFIYMAQLLPSESPECIHLAVFACQYMYVYTVDHAQYVVGPVPK
jgi:hypothetical protein